MNMGDEKDRNAEQTTEQSPTPEKEQAEGHEVFVTKDDSGITSLSEDEQGADPSVTTDAVDENDEESDGDRS